MAITPTSLRTSLAAGAAGAIADTNAEHQAVNDLTTVFNGWATADRAVKADALVINIPAGDGVADDTARVQAAIDSITTGTIKFAPGVWRFQNVAIDGKTNLTISAADAIFKLPNSPTANPMFKVAYTTANTNLTFNVAEIDGNNFAGGAGRELFVIKGGDGLTIRAYVHHTWSNAITFATASASNIFLDVRTDFIGIGYAADNTFVANTGPNGCAIYFATSAPPTDTYIKIRGTDCKGAAFVYVGGCTRMVIDTPMLRRTGYRGIVCAGAASSVTGLKIVEPSIEDVGAVYESSVTPGDVLYGQGTNAIYVGTAPTTAQDAVITGGKIRRTGENAVEGRCVVTGLTTEENGYAYTSFGANLAKDGIFVVTDTIVKGCAIIGPTRYGVFGFDSSSGGQVDVKLQNNVIVNPGTTGIRLQQITAGAITRAVIKGNTVVTITATPTHGIRVTGASGATVAATTMALENTLLGTYSTAAVAVDSPGLTARNDMTTATTPPQFDVFTASGTWTKPASAQLVRPILIGGGAGGGSGRRGAAGTVRCGGGGGAGGALTAVRLDAADLTATVAVTVGAAGAAGAAVTANDTSGNNGTSGTATTFGAYASAAGGSAGSGGSASAGAGGTGGTGTTTGHGGGSASTTGGVGVTAGGAGGAGGGGGSGGGITSADVAGAGGTGIYSRISITNTTAGGVVDGTAPATGGAPSAKGVPGPGGGGGAGSITTVAQTGAAGTGYGAGGGGGGASLNGNNSGAGGVGTAGYCLIVTTF